MYDGIESEEQLIKTEVLKQNLQKISIINKIISIILILLFLVTNVLSNIEILNFSNIYSFSLSHFLIFFLLNLAIHYLLDIKKIHVTKDNYKKIELLINSYVAVFIIIGAIVSVWDRVSYNPLLEFTLIVLICCSFLVLTWKQIIVPLIISGLIIIIGLYFQNGSINAIYKVQVTYVCSLILIAYFISHAFNASFKRSLKFQMEMVREAHHSRILTKKLREANRKLELQASLDPLTNLFNRRAYNDYIKTIQTRSHHETFNLSVIMVDVDCFKLYNDTYGHNEGDRVLVKIGQLLTQIAEDYSCFATRWGGEEFSLILLNQTEEIVKMICKMIQEEMNQLKIHHATSTIGEFVTVSIGACTKKITDENKIFSCIKEADEILYFVKEHGRNNFEHRWVEA